MCLVINGVVFHGCFLKMRKLLIVNANAFQSVRGVSPVPVKR